MLWNVSALNGYPIAATDGEIGTVTDMLYRQSDWGIRWVVVDTGNWLSGRRVLLPIAALGQPDPERHHLPVALTTRQIEASPDVDVTAPISQQFEGVIHMHYGLPVALDHDLSGGHEADFPDGITRDRFQPSPTIAPTGDSPLSEIQIRSLAAITGASIEAIDGDIGHLEDFLVDVADWRVRYLTVHTSNWWPGEKVLISPQSVDKIDWTRAIVHLDVTRQTIKDSPAYVAAQTVDGAFEDLFQSYYGFRGPRL